MSSADGSRTPLINQDINPVAWAIAVSFVVCFVRPLHLFHHLLYLFVCYVVESEEPSKSLQEVFSLREGAVSSPAWTSIHGRRRAGQTSACNLPCSACTMSVLHNTILSVLWIQKRDNWAVTLTGVHSSAVMSLLVLWPFS